MIEPLPFDLKEKQKTVSKFSEVVWLYSDIVTICMFLMSDVWDSVLLAVGFKNPFSTSVSIPACDLSM